MISNCFGEHRWGVIFKDRNRPVGPASGQMPAQFRDIPEGETPFQHPCPPVPALPLEAHSAHFSQTRRRIATAIPQERTLIALSASQPDEITEASADQLVLLPADRGTLPALLWSLLRIVHRDPEGIVGVVPAEHHYGFEEAFLKGFNDALDVARANPQFVITLGAEAKHARADCGWIEPVERFAICPRSPVRRVRRLWERPSPLVAESLFEHGCMWNTGVMTGSAEAFLNVIRRQAPEVFHEFANAFHCDDAEEGEGLSSLYPQLPRVDFLRHPHSVAADFFAAYCLGDIGWNQPAASLGW